jgi:hypothetical protein
MKADDIHCQLLPGSAEKQWRSARRSQALQHNNGMHPTANSAAFIRETWCLLVECAAGDAGRYVSASR